MTGHRKSGKRGRHALPSTEKKSRIVGVRLTQEDLEIIDSVRGGMSRSELLRCALLLELPRPIPAINLETHRHLGQALGNLSALASASRRGGFVPESELLPLLREVRLLLISAKSQLHEDDGE